MMNVAEIAQRPTYPSSKPKGVDWEKLGAEVKKEVVLVDSVLMFCVHSVTEA